MNYMTNHCRYELVLAIRRPEENKVYPELVKSGLVHFSRKTARTQKIPKSRARTDNQTPIPPTQPTNSRNHYGERKIRQEGKEGEEGEAQQRRRNRREEVKERQKVQAQCGKYRSCCGGSREEDRGASC